MKKRTILIPTLLAVIFLAAGMIYKRPLPLAQLCPEPELSLCTKITAYYSTDKAGTDERASFPAGSEDFDRIMEELREQEFRKSFRNLLPSGTKMHRWTEGDFRWELTLEFDEPIPTEDGGTARGTLLRLSNFFGDLSIYNMMDEESIRCRGENQQQWAEEILHILSGE